MGFDTGHDCCVIGYMGLPIHTRMPALHLRHCLKCYIKLGGGVNENGVVFIIDDVDFDVG